MGGVMNQESTLPHSCILERHVDASCWTSSSPRRTKTAHAQVEGGQPGSCEGRANCRSSPRSFRAEASSKFQGGEVHRNTGGSKSCTLETATNPKKKTKQTPTGGNPFRIDTFKYFIILTFTLQDTPFQNRPLLPPTDPKAAHPNAGSNGRAPQRPPFPPSTARPQRR